MTAVDDAPATQAGWALAVISTLGEQGVDGDTIRLATAIDLDRLQSPHARLPLTDYRKLWTLAAAHLGPTAGLQVGRNIRISHWQMLGLGLATSVSARDYLDRLVTYLRLMTTGVNAKVRHEADSAVLTLDYVTDEPLAEIRLECVVVAELMLVRSLFGLDLRPLLGIDLLRERPKDSGPWHAALGPNITWSAPITAVHMPASLLDIQFPAVDPEMSASHLAVMQRALEALDQPQLVRQVRHHLVQMLPAGEPSLADIAAKMRLSPRSLQRRLSDCGTGYRELLDALRQQLASDYLRQDYATGDVAFLLGFAESTSFHAAFKRWTGMTPGQFRSEPPPS